MSKLRGYEPTDLHVSQMFRNLLPRVYAEFGSGMPSMWSAMGSVRSTRIEGSWIPETAQQGGFRPRDGLSELGMQIRRYRIGTIETLENVRTHARSLRLREMGMSHQGQAGVSVGAFEELSTCTSYLQPLQRGGGKEQARGKFGFLPIQH